ncbi:MAG: hypothetical protein IT538_08765, partial [Variibacter sp.]|nr:hypothetical protein [Variibacter sp.]
QGIGSFFDSIVLATGVWAPLALMTVLHGLRIMAGLRGSPWRALLDLFAGRRPPALQEPSFMRIIVGFYGRIVLMQFAIILGGMVAAAVGSIGPLVVLIVLKTMAEIALGDERMAGLVAARIRGQSDKSDDAAGPC